MVDCELYGLNAGGHHFTNVLFHAANAVLLFLLLRRMTGGNVLRPASLSPSKGERLGRGVRFLSVVQAFRARKRQRLPLPNPLLPGGGEEGPPPAPWNANDTTWRSAFVAALFAWHPLHVESVAGFQNGKMC